VDALRIATSNTTVYWQDRSRLVDILLESLHEPAIAEVQAAWGGEIERRLAEYDRGEAKSIDADEVFAKARSIAR
jgi:putative addiction module component (TIGR02574 family)